MFSSHKPIALFPRNLPEVSDSEMQKTISEFIMVVDTIPELYEKRFAEYDKLFEIQRTFEMEDDSTQPKIAEMRKKLNDIRDSAERKKQFSEYGARRKILADHSLWTSISYQLLCDFSIAAAKGYTGSLTSEQRLLILKRNKSDKEHQSLIEAANNALIQYAEIEAQLLMLTAKPYPPVQEDMASPETLSAIKSLSDLISNSIKDSRALIALETGITDSRNDVRGLSKGIRDKLSQVKKLKDHCVSKEFDFVHKYGHMRTVELYETLQTLIVFLDLLNSRATPSIAESARSNVAGVLSYIPGFTRLAQLAPSVVSSIGAASVEEMSLRGNLDKYKDAVLIEMKKICEMLSLWELHGSPVSLIGEELYHIDPAKFPRINYNLLDDIDLEIRMPMEVMREGSVTERRSLILKSAREILNPTKVNIEMEKIGLFISRMRSKPAPEIKIDTAHFESKQDEKKQVVIPVAQASKLPSAPLPSASTNQNLISQSPKPTSSVAHQSAPINQNLIIEPSANIVVHHNHFNSNSNGRNSRSATLEAKQDEKIEAKQEPIDFNKLIPQLYQRLNDAFNTIVRVKDLEFITHYVYGDLLKAIHSQAQKKIEMISSEADHARAENIIAIINGLANDLINRLMAKPSKGVVFILVTFCHPEGAFSKAISDPAVIKAAVDNLQMAYSEFGPSYLEDSLLHINVANKPQQTFQLRDQKHSAAPSKENVGRNDGKHMVADLKSLPDYQLFLNLKAYRSALAKEVKKKPNNRTKVIKKLFVDNIMKNYILIKDLKACLEAQTKIVGQDTYNMHIIDGFNSRLKKCIDDIHKFKPADSQVKLRRK